MKGKIKKLHDDQGIHGYYDFTIKGHKCDKCKKELKNVFDASTIQPEDALEIELHPYYGGYFDKLIEPEAEKIATRMFWLCKECADKLLEEYPFFKSIFDEFDLDSYELPE